MFDEVLVGTDFGPGGGDAVALARLLVAPGGRLTLGHVLAGDPSVYRGQSEVFMAQERARALDRLDRERRRLSLAAAEDGNAPGPQVSTACVFAPAAGRGLHFMARRQRADLIVVGASRRGAVGRILFGDDTRAVLRRSPCAVAIAPAGYTGAGKLRLVGVGFDGSPESRRAAEAARRVADAHGAELAGVTVVPAVSGAGPLPIREAMEAERRIAVEDLAALGGVEGHVLWGGDAERLAAFSRRLDLLVLGSRALSSSGLLMRGSTSARVARQAECPVLVLMDGGSGPSPAPLGDGDHAEHR